MKTLTKEKLRYRKVISGHLSAQDHLMQLMKMDELDFRMIEYKMGISLLDMYFPEAVNQNEAQIITRFKKNLLEDKKHGYWNWFLNRKRQQDYTLGNQFEVVFGYDYDLQWVREEYELEMKSWENCVELHEQLRKFITNSETLFSR